MNVTLKKLMSCPKTLLAVLCAFCVFLSSAIYSVIAISAQNVVQPENYSLPLTFDEQYNPFVQIDNVYSNTEHWTNNGIELVGGEEALNGEYSLKIENIRSGNTRTEISWAKIEGNPDFSTNDFTAVTGIMLRVKIENDGNTSHKFRLTLSQSGLSGYQHRMLFSLKTIHYRLHLMNSIIRLFRLIMYTAIPSIGLITE